MNSDSDTGRPKPRRPKSRDVSSRYLSSSSLSSPERKFDLQSPNQTVSPKQKPPRSFQNNRRQRSFGGSSDDDFGLSRGLWSTPTVTRTSSSGKKLDTFGDYLGKDRLKNLKIDNNEYKVSKNIENPLFEYEMAGEKTEKENHKSFFGFPRRSSKTPVSKSSYYSPGLSGNETGIAPGRLSVDETALRRRPSLGPAASETGDSGSEWSDVSSSYKSSVSGKKSSLGSFKSSTATARRSGVEISSKYLEDLRAKTRVETPDRNLQINSSDKSPKARTPKSSMVSGGGPAVQQKRAMSTGRESLPPVDNNRGKPPPAFSNLRPKGKGVGDLLSKGLGLFKGNNKKSVEAAEAAMGGGSAVVVGGLEMESGGCGAKPVKKVSSVPQVSYQELEGVHELRLMSTRLVQWSFVNARGDFVNLGKTNKAESNFVGVWHSITQLQHSVVQKKLQLDRQKLEMKLNFILHSHIKSLEAWGDMEAQNLSAVSSATDSFQSAISRVPLVDGAKVMDPHSAYLALQHAANLATSINSMLYTTTPTAEKTIKMISELAEVVRQEKALLHEFLELLQIISTLEIQERSLKCNLIQLKHWQQQQQNQLQLSAS